MANSFQPAQLERFRREAKKLCRALSIPHSEALDRIAVENGFSNWSLLVKHSDSAGANSSTPQATGPKQPNRIRHYLHGDISATDPTQCYCVRCDLFCSHQHLLPVSHHTDGKDGERYLRDLANWNALPDEHRLLRFRPEDAPNILAAPAIAARDAREATRSPFHRWLDGQRNRNDPIGDLARDILRDASFPIAVSTRRELGEYLMRYGLHIEKAFRLAWREFSNEEHPKWSLVDAFADELRITKTEAEELVDAEPQELVGHSDDGFYGFEFDFTEHASPKLAAKLMKRHKSLKIRVGPWFYDGVEHGNFPR